MQGTGAKGDGLHPAVAGSPDHNMAQNRQRKEADHDRFHPGRGCARPGVDSLAGPTKPCADECAWNAGNLTEYPVTRMTPPRAASAAATRQRFGVGRTNGMVSSICQQWSASLADVLRAAPGLNGLPSIS